jgi:hypothetical protein
MATTMRWVRLRAKGIARKAVLAAIGQPMARADHDRITKSFRQPILKNVNAPAHDKNDNGGDHDRKGESCFAFHASLGDSALRYWATIKIASPALPLVSFPRRSCQLRDRPKCVRR